MAAGRILNPAASLHAFRSISAVAAGGSLNAISIPCPLSTLVNSHKYVQSSSHSACYLLSRLLAFPSSPVSLCCSSSANSTLCFPSALVPAAYRDKRAQLSLLTVCLFLRSFPAIPSPSVRPSPHNMPRERPRMGCRRGSSRGRASRQHSSTTSDPTSDASEFSGFSYPATRSGRGRGRGHDRADVCEHHSHSHTACLWIPCSLGNASFIVSVTIELSENAVGSGEALQEAPLHQRRANQNIFQSMNTGGQPTMYTNVNAGPSAPAGGAPSTSASHPSDSKDSDQFGCRIVEEKPSTSNEDSTCWRFQFFGPATEEEAQFPMDSQFSCSQAR